MEKTPDLSRFFNPKTVAVIGASNVEGKMGNIFVRHVLDGFPGRIYPIHPTEKKISGLDAYPHISRVPEPIDLVIPLIPSKPLLSFIESCPKDRVRFLLAIPSGFGEVPKGGKALEENLIRLSRERGIRIIGPNSAGMFNCIYGLNASMMPGMPAGDRGLSVITQSGGFGMAVYMYCQNHQMGLSKLCDMGNTGDISLQEMLEYMGRDEDTRIIGLYLEAIPDPQPFFIQANKIAEKKPVILTKLGRTRAGSRASFAHIGLNSTGEINGEQEELGKDQGRIISVQTGREMLNIARASRWQGFSAGNRVGIITGSGGIGAELTDLCIEHGLAVPEFSEALQAAIRPHLPPYAGVANPIDLTPLWWEYYRIYPPLIRALQDSDEVDLLIVAVIDVATTQEKLMHSLAEIVTQCKKEGETSKPVLVFWGATHQVFENMRILEKAHIPCYLTTREVVQTAADIVRNKKTGNMKK